MTQSSALFETNIKSLPFLHRGKVRDIYAVGDDKLLIIQTDRLSAFDVILPTAVPGKGKLLTALSDFWFKKLAHILPNHLTGISPESVVAEDEREQVERRAFVIRRLKPLPIEAIVRGYVVGSGWKDYQKNGAICGIQLPAGLKLAEKLPGGAIFTPSTKAPAGAHDENIPLAQVEAQLGKALTAKVRKASARQPFSAGFNDQPAICYPRIFKAVGGIILQLVVEPALSVERGVVAPFRRVDLRPVEFVGEGGFGGRGLHRRIGGVVGRAERGGLQGEGKQQHQISRPGSNRLRSPVRRRVRRGRPRHAWSA